MRVKQYGLTLRKVALGLLALGVVSTIAMKVGAPYFDLTFVKGLLL